MSQDIGGSVAIVTGASSGIGAATAEALAAEGTNVVLAARREERLNELADAIEGSHDVETATVPTDVREEDAVEALVEATVERFGGLDLLVNNAGLARGSDVETMSTADYRTMMDTNVDGMFLTTRAALPHLRESGGVCVFVGSFAGQYPRPFNPVYAATKWWTRGFALSLAGQLEGEVAVTVVNPAAVRTEFSVGSSDDDAEFSTESFAEQFVPGEAVEPEEVADAIVFAAKQSPSMVAELDLYNRDKYELFS
ncbi:SDR family oxidoreductase [Halomarina rubra]|uniref:SDR family oxidoreductase n=1 Tax=Halomarina rubra TaxID=2071873 RepID=A0ABD6ATN1_9EURY|nr:SDR family oxidoreductase [Halomarina rubra]